MQSQQASQQLIIWKPIFNMYFVNTSSFFKQIEETHIIFC